MENLKKQLKVRNINFNNQELKEFDDYLTSYWKNKK